MSRCRSFYRDSKLGVLILAAWFGRRNNRIYDEGAGALADGIDKLLLLDTLDLS